MHVEPALEALLDSSKVWLRKKRFKDSRFLLRPGAFHSTQKINDMSYNQLVSVKKRTPRQDDSILLRHMDDVVGTGPEEQLLKQFEHMKTSLYLTDVIMLRNEGSTVNFFWVLKTPRKAGASR